MKDETEEGARKGGLRVDILVLRMWDDAARLSLLIAQQRESMCGWGMKTGVGGWILGWLAGAPG